ncbi:MAG: glycine cleavage system aminomethyltransferase GcvT [Chloroflexi bacterium]|uniref:Aminomethyltransferase n=1 Tax=Candidatus Chlorohelix allophototropha TaxID=3003348 RepID=A0A8T7M7J7_9CHLR|nr:glycine cleavage system aminomethyltransferase GcvT [Chloroflexota bacterium]WJW68049.1 glycine cleavage system aminomethyltransferase GcvT [Chloroflexota bacterium L227-S17]
MTDIASLKKTPLHTLHQQIGARLIEFGGWHMPVQYSGIIDEHKAVRTAVGLFDLCHMGEFEISGATALDFLQYLCTNDISKLEVGQAQYNLMCYPDGGIVDDLIVYRLPNKYYVVVNAANIAKDHKWMLECSLIRGSDVIIQNVSERTALISIQGPLSLEILAPLTDVAVGDLKYYSIASGKVGELSALVARTGYTGEDGYEIFVKAADAETLWNLLSEAGKDKGIKPIGLGARDTLRLEAKMALYGNDIDARVNPLEAGLERFVNLDKGNFSGRATLVAKQKEGIKRKLVGFEMKGREIGRHGYKITKDGKEIGFVTSGAPSPSLGKNIGLALVSVEFAEVGTTFQVVVRDQPAEAVVVKTPFYKKAKK